MRPSRRRLRAWRRRGKGREEGGGRAGGGNAHGGDEAKPAARVAAEKQEVRVAAEKEAAHVPAEKENAEEKEEAHAATKVRALIRQLKTPPTARLSRGSLGSGRLGVAPRVARMRGTRIGAQGAHK